MKQIKVLIVVMALALTTLFLPVTINAQMGVCGGSRGSFKSYMTIGVLSTSSVQYNYLINNTFDRGDGLLTTSDGFIAVAMGPHYGSIGDKLYITFDNGQVTPVVIGDYKAHYMEGCYGMSSLDGSIVEGILSGNPSDAYSTARYHGNIGQAYTEFAGSYGIASIARADGYVPEVIQSEPVPETPVTSEVVQSEPTPEIPVASPQTYEPVVEELVIEEEEEKKDSLMIIYIPNEEHENLLFIDTEFSGSKRELIQVALVNFRKMVNKDNLYYFSDSLNIYKNTRVTESFETYTNIKQGFLGNHGVKAEDFIYQVKTFVENQNLNNCNTLLIGHGLSQDYDLLLKEGCNLLFVDQYDTYEQAKSILGIKEGLSLTSLVATSGFFINSVHDAYQDALMLIPIFSHLKTTEYLQ